MRVRELLLGLERYPVSRLGEASRARRAPARVLPDGGALPQSATRRRGTVRRCCSATRWRPRLSRWAAQRCRISRRRTASTRFRSTRIACVIPSCTRCQAVRFSTARGRRKSLLSAVPAYFRGWRDPSARRCDTRGYRSSAGRDGRTGLAHSCIRDAKSCRPAANDPPSSRTWSFSAGRARGSATARRAGGDRQMPHGRNQGDHGDGDHPRTASAIAREIGLIAIAQPESRDRRCSCIICRTASCSFYSMLRRSSSPASAPTRRCASSRP